MLSDTNVAAAERLAVWAAGATLIGLTISGPLGLVIVMLTRPQEE